MLLKKDPSQVEGLARFFKTGPGEYGEGDIFLGIKVPETRSVVKNCWRETTFEHLEECLRSEYHEMRLAALLAMIEIFSHAKKDAALRERCVNFYLGHTDRINNWDHAIPFWECGCSTRTGLCCTTWLVTEKQSGSSVSA